MEAWMTSKPGAHGRCLVSPIVVHHQMHVQLRRDVGFDRAQELQELSAAMAPVQLADDFSGGDIQGGEQRRSAMAFVIVRTALGYAGGQRQNWLSPVQCLNLAPAQEILSGRGSAGDDRQKLHEKDDSPELPTIDILTGVSPKMQGGQAVDATTCPAERLWRAYAHSRCGCRLMGVRALPRDQRGHA